MAAEFYAIYCYATFRISLKVGYFFIIPDGRSLRNRWLYGGLGTVNDFHFGLSRNRYRKEQVAKTFNAQGFGVQSHLFDHFELPLG